MNFDLSFSPRLPGQPGSVRDWTLWGSAFVLLWSSHSGRSLTNDADAVVAWLAAAGHLEGRHVLYLDTELHWDELLHDGRRFIGFAPGAAGLGAAMRIARERSG